MVYSPDHGPTDYRTERNMQSSIQPPPSLAERPDGDDLRHCDGEMDCMGHSFQVTKGEWLVKPPSLMSGQQTDVDILPEQWEEVRSHSTPFPLADVKIPISYKKYKSQLF